MSGGGTWQVVRCVALTSPRSRISESIAVHNRASEKLARGSTLCALQTVNPNALPQLGRACMGGVRGMHASLASRALPECEGAPDSPLHDHLGAMIAKPKPTRMGLVDRESAREMAREALGTVRAAIDPDVIVESLSAGERQLVEIAKALSKDVKLLILDEPTNSLDAVPQTRLRTRPNGTASQGYPKAVPRSCPISVPFRLLFSVFYPKWDRSRMYLVLGQPWDSLGMHGTGLGC